MAEQADATDLKSVDLRIVRVRFPPKPLAKDSQRYTIGSVNATNNQPLACECNSAVESRFSKPMVVGSNPIVRFMKSNDDIYYEVRIGTAMMVLTILTSLIHSALLLFIFMYMAEKVK